jgi:hypothetical protein
VLELLELTAELDERDSIRVTVERLELPLMTPDDQLDWLAHKQAQLDQTKAGVLEDMRSEPNPEELDGFLLELEELTLEVRALRARVS